MATHSRILAWKMPGTEEPSGLQSMESPRVRHDLATKPQTLIKYSYSAFEGNTRKRKGVGNK